MWQRKILLLLFLSMVLPSSSQAQQSNSLTEQVAEMSLRQKVGQMFVMSFFGTNLNEPARNLLQTWQPGAVVFLPSNLESPEQITRLTNSIQQTLINSGSVPAFIAIDQEGGIIARLQEGFTEFPVPMLLTASQDTDLAFRFGAALGSELQAVGINMNLAPVADLNTNPNNTVIGRRSFGTYPEQVAPIVAAVVQGLQAQGVLATAKHFPGHGDTSADSHVQLPVVNLSTEFLRTRELLPFQAVIDANIAAIMTGHLYYPALEAERNLPASLSAAVIQGLLRDEMQYRGLVITDAMDMDAIDTVYSPEQAAIRAILAGNDLILIGAHISPQKQADAMQAVVEAVRRGEISEAQIDESVLRILGMKARFGILYWQALDPDTSRFRIGQTGHTALVAELFEKGISLVRGTVPSATQEVLFIFPGNQQSLWQACRADNWRGLSVSDSPTTQEIQAARQAAQSADAIVVISQNAQSNEALQRLVAVLPTNRSLVVATWSPYDERYLPRTAGYMLTYSPLAAAYAPLCAILKGERPALGQLVIDLD